MVKNQKNGKNQSPQISDKKLSKWYDILRNDKRYQNNQNFDQVHSSLRTWKKCSELLILKKFL